ncbi:hypothetical protein [Sandaracinus amylolyticus]|uniref:RNA-binding protein, RRM domain protein n=1 Tax=Sandaracinus amylolyticus TaxID=927083 RepID=A0A0F6WA29_9BACT|nr:hypothetical protein [Sandaracinus amylolyticus]AKF11293.1 RNA-binding protein, RRM domain protein [Sandaracinus amylolyticus]
MSEKKKKTLEDADLVTERPMGRRSSIALLGGAVLGAAGIIAATTPSQAEAQCTDSDRGPNADPGGRGRGNGVTDSDGGPNADRAGCGRGRRSCSDSDPNDPAGRGRHC